MSTESIHIVSDKGFEEKLVSLTVSVTNLAEVVEVHSDKWAAAIALCEQSAAAAADSAAASARDSANTAIEVAEIRFLSVIKPCLQAIRQPHGGRRAAC